MGFTLTLLGTFLSALKGIVTNQVQVGKLKLHPLDLLLRMSPLAAVQCIVFAGFTGELRDMLAYCKTTLTATGAVALLVNGAIAFLLNVVSFTANKKTSALTMSVAANVGLTLVEWWLLSLLMPCVLSSSNSYSSSCPSFCSSYSSSYSPSII